MTKMTGEEWSMGLVSMSKLLGDICAVRESYLRSLIDTQAGMADVASNEERTELDEEYERLQSIIKALNIVASFASGYLNDMASELAESTEVEKWLTTTNL